jgi:hypothetical protein
MTRKDCCYEIEKAMPTRVTRLDTYTISVVMRPDGRPIN